MPIIISFGSMAMSEVRTLEPIMIPFYTNLIIGIISLFVCSFSAKGFLPSTEDFEVNPEWRFWLLALVVLAACYVVCWQLKVIAFKYDYVTRV